MAKATLESIRAKLIDLALSYPETFEDHPWGESAIKVRPTNKAFTFISLRDGKLSASFKLPQSRDMAADLPFAEPTHYGMGKYGWVTAHITPKEPPFDLLKAWLNESFRAVAPKKVVKQLDLGKS
jgi:predicted DNA-binding protein (MmcQ/YjbR family)